jgi:L-cystine transport system substrate-binding protein
MRKMLRVSAWAIGLLVIVLTGCAQKTVDPAPISAPGNAPSAPTQDTPAQETPADVRTLLVGINPGSPPLQYYDDDDNLTGYEVELLRAIDEQLPQYTIEFVVTEYKSMFAALQAGKVDIVTANLRRNAERENYLHTYRGINYWANKIVVLDDDTTINGLEDLEGKRVGTSQGTLSATFMENYIKETGKNIELVYPADTITELLAGRIDCFIVADYLVDAVYNRQYEDEGIKLKVVGEPIDTGEGVEKDRNVYFFLSNGNEDARNAISDAVYALREDGTIAKLMLEYIGGDRTGLIDVAEEEVQIQALGR